MKQSFWLLIAIVVSFMGCRPCNPIIVDNGPLPDSVLNLVPYKQGEVYSFQHSNGFVIDFTTHRQTKQLQSYSTHCSEYEYLYEQNVTTLQTEYPLFNLSLWIDNQYPQYIDFYIYVGPYSTRVPLSLDDEWYDGQLVDNLEINSALYHNVFQLGMQRYSFLNEQLKVDSLYYSYEKGIIKILMTNGEHFTQYP